VAQTHSYYWQQPVAERPAGSADSANDSAVGMAFRSVLFVTVLLCVWTSFNPFPSADQVFVVTDAGSNITQTGYSVMFVVLAAWCSIHQPLRMLVLVRPILILALAWCAVSVVTSWEPSLSERRFLYALVMIGIAGMMLLVPKDSRHFADLMGVVALLLLAASYVGVALLPSLSIHQASDVAEPELAGDWRGIFGHKNGASAAMVVFVFSGLMLRSLGRRAVGLLIIALALPFLWFTHSRTALAELPMVVVISLFAQASRNPVIGMALTLATILGLNLMAIGSIYSPSLHSLLQDLYIDPTFTGRTDIWRFIIVHIAERPITGYGFSSFWMTEHAVYGFKDLGWVSSVSSGHNGYLDIALQVGIPGAFLMILWLVIAPLVDFYRVSYVPANDPVKLFFFRLLLFAAFESCFESSFLLVNAFLVFLVWAGFSLRFMSRLPLAA
jgi:O-antigen ligase